MNMDLLFTKKDKTFGLCKTKRSEATRIPGFFDKEILRAALNQYLDLSDAKDVEIRFSEAVVSGASCLLLYLEDKEDYAIVIAGRDDRQAGGAP